MVVKSVNGLDCVIIAIYMFSMIVIGFFVSRNNKNDQDYFKCGNRIPWVMAGISLFIGQVSAYMFVAASGQAYSNGFASALLYCNGGPILLLVALLFAHKWRRTRINSPIEYIGQRYGAATQKFYTFVQIPIFILILGNCLYILCIFLSSALKLSKSFEFLSFNFGSLEICIVLTGIVITLYTSSGGLWAVLITDTVQFILVMLVSIFIVILSIRLFACQGNVIQAVNDYIAAPPTPDYFKLVKPSQPLYFTVAWIVMAFITTPADYGTIQRCFSVPNEKDAKKLTLFAAAAFIIVPLVWLSPVFILRKHLPDMNSLWPHLTNPAEASYVTISLSLLPNGVIGLTLSAILAASMSSMSTVYNFLSSIVTENVYKPLCAPNCTAKQAMQAGKIITFLLGIASIILAIILSKGGSAFETTYSIASYVQIAVAFPLLVGIFIKSVYQSTAIVSSAACFTATFLVGFCLPKIFVLWGVNISSHQLFTLKVAVAIVVSAAVYLVSYILYSAKGRKNDGVEEFFAKLNKPVSEDNQGMIYIPNLKMYDYVAWSVIFYAAVLFFIHFTHISDDPDGVTLLIGLAFFATGLLTKWLISPKYSPFKIVKNQRTADKEN